MGISRWFPTITAKILVLFYSIIVIWWFSIFIRGLQETTENFMYSLVYGLLPFGWGIIGLVNARRWGGLKSSMGRGVAFLSAGLFAWGIGNLAFAYYNLVLQIAVPYPSLADAGFILIYPLSAIGVTYLSRATGMTLGLRGKRGKLGLLIIPLFFILLSYYLLFVIARGGDLAYEGDKMKLFLDIAFPIGDVIVITLATIIYGLSFRYLGGRFKIPILAILLGFVFAYVTDFSFSYTTTTETFFVGNWVDLLYPTTFFLISWGLTLLDPRLVARPVSSQASSPPLL